MPVRLVALDEGPDITLNHSMVVVGRHPACDTRLDSLRVSRHHCCMTQENGEVVVRDLGSTNGIRINGQRVEIGRLRPGDELSIAHIRYRLENGQGHEQTIAESNGQMLLGARHDDKAPVPNGLPGGPPSMPQMPVVPMSPVQGQGQGQAPGDPDENPIAAELRKILSAGLADRCRIQVIVQMPEGGDAPAMTPSGRAPAPADQPAPHEGPAHDEPASDEPLGHASEHHEECHSSSSP
ncbi:MAG: FHA domain-containing protein [Isosphaeraceae bacterium]